MTNRSTRALFHSKTLNTALRAFSFRQDMEVRRKNWERGLLHLKWESFRSHHQLTQLVTKSN